MLQTSFRTIDGAWCFSVPHTAILWLRHRLQQIWTTRNHPRIRLPPGTTPSRDWHIRLKHLWDQWWPSSRTVVETPGHYNARISTQAIRDNLSRFTLHAQRSYRVLVLNRQRRAARLHQVTVQRISFLKLPHSGLTQIKCGPYTALASILTDRYPIVHPRGPHWLPDKVTWTTSRNHGGVMPGFLGGLGWHPTGKNYSSEPIHVTGMQSSAWDTWFVTTIADLAALNDMLHRAKETFV